MLNRRTYEECDGSMSTILKDILQLDALLSWPQLSLEQRNRVVARQWTLVAAIRQLEMLERRSEPGLQRAGAKHLTALQADSEPIQSVKPPAPANRLTVEVLCTA